MAKRYRFSDFVLSPRRRLLVRGGVEQPLIPRYFDLLVFLVEQRHEAVHRRDIFDRVWNDVIVSDSALSQAIRTIRRTLADDSREPRYIRTVSRHGYRFVCDDVVEEDEGDAWPLASVPTTPSQPSAIETADDPFEPLLQRLTAPNAGAQDEEERREAAELLHGLGTAEALVRLGTRPRHTLARALLRDTRWDVPSAGPVPLLGTAGSAQSATALMSLRLRRARRIVGVRWATASVGGGAAGIVGGAVGGLMLAAVSDGTAPVALSAALAAIGGACGALGGAGVGAGLAVAETVARSRRAIAAACAAAAGGCCAGALVQYVGQWTLSALVGLQVDVGGALEGILLGGAAGVGYAIAAPPANGGIAAPRGRHRVRTVCLTAAACGIAALALTLLGRPLVGGTIHTIAQQSQGAQAVLTPLGRLVGEPTFGPLTRALIGTGEGALFGIGLALGLTRRV